MEPPDGSRTTGVKETCLYTVDGTYWLNLHLMSDKDFIRLRQPTFQSKLSQRKSMKRQFLKARAHRQYFSRARRRLISTPKVVTPRSQRRRLLATT